MSGTTRKGSASITVLRWTYSILWLSAVATTLSGMTLFSIYWIRQIEVDEDTDLGSFIKDEFADAGNIGFNHLSDEEAETIGLELAAADAAETDSPKGHRRRLMAGQGDQAPAPPAAAGADAAASLNNKDSQSPEEQAAALEADAMAAEALEPLDVEPTFKLVTKKQGLYMYIAITIPLAWAGLVAIILSSFPPISVLSPRVSSVQSSMRRFFSTPLPPVHFWKSWVGGFSVGDALLYSWYLGVNLAYLVYRVKAIAPKYKKWNDGDEDVHGFNKDQYYLEQVALTLAKLYIVQAPFLFMPLSRGGILTSFFGVKYGIAIKWHRWVGYFIFLTLFFHGFLYNALWISAGILGKIGFKWEYYQGASNLAGQIALLSFIVLVVTSLPYVRKTFYKD